jgi:methyl-accepting chemotaxis protein
MAQALDPEEDAGEVARKLGRIATTLTSIANSVGQQAESATAMVREAADHARRTADLASELVELGMLAGMHLHQQSLRTSQAQSVAAEGADAMNVIAAGAGDIEGIVGLIAKIATESRLLALNARIEAARGGEAGRGFGVVANAMSTLSAQTFDATRSVDDRTQSLLARLDHALSLFGASREQAEEAQRGLGEMMPVAERQSEAATRVRMLADETLDKVEQSATSIGRVGSAALTVRMLAGEIENVAKRIGG